jgi:hypothetical protein
MSRVYVAGPPYAVAYTGGTLAHPWTVYVADAVCADLEEAVRALPGP